MEPDHLDGDRSGPVLAPERTEHMGQELWIELESATRDQLELQVELSLDRHHQLMLKHGLAKCKYAVDIGTGNGLFLGRVAQRHPTIHFLRHRR